MLLGSRKRSQRDSRDGGARPARRPTHSDDNEPCMMIDQACRLATDNEIAFYADRLYPQQIIADLLWDFPPEARRISG